MFLDPSYDIPMFECRVLVSDLVGPCRDQDIAEVTEYVATNTLGISVEERRQPPSVFDGFFGEKQTKQTLDLNG
jgi:hypothetical protein